MIKLIYDIGGMSVKGRIFHDNKEIKNLKINYPEINAGDLVPLPYIIDLIIKNICENVQNKNFELALACPGVIDFKNKLVKTDSAICDININLDQIFKNKFKNLKKFIIENDAKAAAIGEVKFGYGNKFKNIMLLTIGTGIGGAIVINGELYRGISGFAGEVSKVWVDHNQGLPNVILAHKASTMAMLKEYANSKDIPLSEIDGVKLFEKYFQNDKIAREVIQGAVTNLANFIFNAQTLLDLEAYLIGGGISEVEEFSVLIKDELNKLYEAQEIIEFKPQILSCQLKNDAAIHGMLYLLNGEK